MAWPDVDQTPVRVKELTPAGAPASPASPLPALIPIDEAARLAHVSRRTIYHWIARGLVRTERVASGRLRVVTSSLFKESAA